MHQQLNAELDDIWSDLHRSEPAVLAPMYFDPINPCDIVFVGMNPSFNEAEMQSWFTRNSWPETPKDYYAWSARHNVDANREAQTRAHFQTNYKFFNYHHPLIADLGAPTWVHLDLFAFRKTDQKAFLALCKSNPTFEHRSMQLFEQVLQAIHPRMILLWNAAAAHKFFDAFTQTLKIVFDEELGTYVSSQSGGKLPIFASSMLTQGTMDRYSRRRLLWHIKRVYKSIHTQAALQ